MDEIWRLSLGENADITNALYQGDYSKSLEQAQFDKHAFILKEVGFSPGDRILDIGCGWGGFLKTVMERGGIGVGITISTKQAETCRRSGLEVHLRDWKNIGPDTFGGFDAVVSVGAFEHFCSEEEYISGRQDEVYSRFFSLCHNLLPARGRLFVQTMTWGRRVPHPSNISLSAPKGSDEYILAVLRRFYSASGWLPGGVEDIERVARPYFRIVLVDNGRLDYIETMRQWGNRINRLSAVKVMALFRLALHVFSDRDCIYRVRSYLNGYNQLCFERQVMDHYRIVLERL
jgi:cyclopropane-fatty-acyl-phospholipid synthase